MRSHSARLANKWLLASYAGLATLWIAAGCGRPGYMLDTEAVCRRLNAVNAKVNVTQWAAKEIESHMAAATNRPTSLTITNVPGWVEKVDAGNRAYTINYEVDPKNDHVSVDSITGRGCWGILIGGGKFVPDWQAGPLFYLVKGDPGLYAWHSRSDY